MKASLRTCSWHKCRTRFVPRVGGRPQEYCCQECRNLASEARKKARDPEAYLEAQRHACKRYRGTA